MTLLLVFLGLNVLLMSHTVTPSSSHQLFCSPSFSLTCLCENLPNSPVSPGVLLLMCKVQRSACACVWVVGPSGIKPTSCVTDSNTLVVSSTHLHTRLSLSYSLCFCVRWWWLMLSWTPCRALASAPLTTCRPTTRTLRVCSSGFPGLQISETPSSSSSLCGFTCARRWRWSWSGWLWLETGSTWSLNGKKTESFRKTVWVNVLLWLFSWECVGVFPQDPVWRKAVLVGSWGGVLRWWCSSSHWAVPHDLWNRTRWDFNLWPQTPPLSIFHVFLSPTMWFLLSCSNPDLWFKALRLYNLTWALYFVLLVNILMFYQLVLRNTWYFLTNYPPKNPTSKTLISELQIQILKNQSWNS